MKRPEFFLGEKLMLFFTSGLCVLLMGAGGLFTWNNRVPDVVISETPQPTINAYSDYQSAVESFVKQPRQSVVDTYFDNSSSKFFSLYSQEYLRHYPYESQVGYLRLNSPALTYLHQGLSKEYVQIPERNGKRAIKYSTFSDLADLLALEAHVQARKGQWDKAANRLLEMLHLSYQIPRGGGAEAAARANVIRGRAFKEWMALLPHISAAKAFESARQIEQWHKKRVTFAETLREEKNILQSTLLELSGSTGSWRLYYSTGCVHLSDLNPNVQYARNDPDFLTGLRLAWMNKAHLSKENARCMDWQISQLQLPLGKQQNAQWPFPEDDDAVAYLVYPRFRDLAHFAVIRDMQISLLETMLALRAYKNDNHHYPRSLSLLVPKYLSKVPLDPFRPNQTLSYHLKPLRYVARRKLIPSAKIVNLNAPVPSNAFKEEIRYASLPFTLYSVGPDIADNNGQPYEDLTPSGPSRYEVSRWSEWGSVDFVAGINS